MATQRVSRNSEAELVGLVARMAVGDEAAFSRFHRVFGPDVRGIARRWLWTSAAAEEAASDAFLQLWRQAGRYDPARGSVAAWVGAIAHSRARDVLRGECALARHEVPLDGSSQASSSTRSEVVHAASPNACDGDFGDLLVRDGRLRRLVSAMAPARRQVVALAFYSGMTHQEIAAHCGLPLGTVKAHLRRGLEALRERCVDEGLAPRHST